MTKKQYYIPGKEYKWTWESWKAVDFEGDTLSPVLSCSANKPIITIRFKLPSLDETIYYNDTDTANTFDWGDFEGSEEYWYFSVSEEGVEIPEYLIQFYGEKEKEGKMSDRCKFEGAPDDATYYCPHVHGEVDECWVKYTDGEVLFSYGKEFTWRKWSSYEDVEHFFIPRPKKEILTVDDLEVGEEYIMCLGVNEDRHIVYWGKNQEVIFITNLLYHTYEHAFIKDIYHFREIPKKTREQELSEKYNVSVDTIKKMMQDGLIKEED